MNLKKNTLISLLLFLSFANYAQEVQWASEVLEVSSEYETTNKSSPQFKAIQALGKPTVLSSFGESPCAWAPKDKIASIKVKYAKPMRINRVIINQIFHSGCIAQVFIVDTLQKEKKVYEQLEINPNERGNLLNIVFPLTKTPIYAVKVVLDIRKSDKYYQIDAIGIANTDKDYEIKINSLFSIGEMSKPENLGENINSAYQEISPAITPDGKTLYFTRSKHPENTGSPDKQDIWFAEMQADSTLSEAKNIGEPINDATHNSAFAVNAQKRLLLNNIYINNKSSVKGLSIAHYKDNQWLFPEKVNIDNYYNNHKSI